MTEKKPKKPKVEIQTRTPEKRGIFDELGKGRQQNVKHPFGELMNFAGDTREANPTLPYHSSVETTLPQATLDYTTLPETTVSPKKNFTKFSNSLLKEAIPEGLFRGQSKHTYDVLYLRTRGAINPVRQIQLTKTELVRLTGLEIKTIQRHLSFLRSSGLIIVDPKIGDHKGAIYEVKIPEEITLPDPTLVQSGVGETTLGKTSAKYTPDPSAVDTTVGYTQVPIDIKPNESPKTFFKTLSFKLDDEAPIVKVLEKLNAMARKLTGKDLTKRDLEKWTELTDILISETVIASARTGSVSATMAFMTENLRRRLYTKPRQGAKKETRPNHLDVGKGSEGKDNEELSSKTWQSPLTDEQRENILQALQEAKAANSIFFQEFKAYGEIEYMTEDFKWLIENLEKGS